MNVYVHFAHSDLVYEKGLVTFQAIQEPENEHILIGIIENEFFGLFVNFFDIFFVLGF